jgi:hypothetical protein
VAKSNGRPLSYSRRVPTSAKDAIALLKADHRQVEQLFAEFEKARDRKRKTQLAEQICKALKIHTQLEEEVFYPEFLEATDYEEIYHEAKVEHESAKRLIAELEADPSDEYFDARMAVLSKIVEHHVNEEEKLDGMFIKGRRAGMDLDEIGERLQARRSELEADRSLLGKAKKLIASAGASLTAR